MEKRRIGLSPLKSSLLGLGCMSLGTDAKKAENIIKTAYENGINYFDTADLYDYGTNEEIVGKALKPIRDNVLIATKVGNRAKDDLSGWYWDPSKSYIKKQIKNSLKRLQTDYIDLYQLHGGTLDDPIDETIEAFDELKQEGLIRAYGFSSIRPNVIREYAPRSSADSNMMQYSLLDRRPEEQAFEVLKENNVSVITRGPLAKGLLSAKFKEKLADSFVHYSRHELEELIPKLQELFEGRSLTEIALLFNAAHPEVSTIIAGASSPEQVTENIKAINQASLSREEIEILKSLTKTDGYKEHR
ncbi:aldo/keto reductase [Jeotgalibacillus haloalkalitolerans]|uniref:Aldo/keto reductase n=1 Tax=Jeotgalibacillus haloalkalitolerans TaxID=3104292 RepID=A0ABU5KLC8_9BACL|nr:aldo/keto reductase [Jeotgalibacillus sp. HH7-29]MDZ5712072.1 aldo/keto reductase [Jeotgalibacillus sp. HH7-29]